MRAAHLQAGMIHHSCLMIDNNTWPGSSKVSFSRHATGCHMKLCKSHKVSIHKSSLDQGRHQKQSRVAANTLQLTLSNV